MKYDIASSNNIQRDPWFSPHLVINAMGKLTKDYGTAIETRGEFKLAKEMFDAAVALLGAYNLHPNNKYFMQPNLQSGSPDIFAVKQTEIENEPVLLEKTKLELVRMNDYAFTDNVVEFLMKTKFSYRKSYDEETLIICMISKKIHIDPLQISKQLNEIKPKPTVYILGKIQNQIDKWSIFSPYPNLIKPIFFSISETMKSYSLPGVITLHRGYVKKIIYGEGIKQKTSLYKIFNLNEKNIAKFRLVR